MKHTFPSLVFLVLLLTGLLAAGGATGAPVAAPLDAAPLPAPLGVNIHFADARGHEQDLELLARLGVRWVRMDLSWGSVEREKGVYSLDGYVRLTEALAAKGIRPLYILDYGNPLYEGGLPPKTPEGIAAFARFAGAAAERLKGRGVLYELWNEPNIPNFWKPAPDPAAYVALMRPAAAAVRAADPRAVLVGPASSTIDLSFLEAIFKGGYLDLVDGVSVHPYRSGPPETAVPEYGRLRALIARYAAPGRRVPVLSGEWGYSSTNVSEEVQANYLARQWLVNAWQDIRLSIWYDWKNDGPDPKEPEHRFGTLTQDLQPKPAFTAARELIAALSGYRCVKRLATTDPEHNFALLFSTPDGKQQKVAAWTTDAVPRPVILEGGAVPSRWKVTARPAYIAQEGDPWRLEAAWSVSVPPAVEAGPIPRADLRPRVSVRVTNPTGAPVEFRLGPGEWDGPARFELKPGETAVRERGVPDLLRSDPSHPVTVTLEAPALGWKSSQEAALWLTNPLRLALAPARNGLELTVEGEGLEGLTARLTGPLAPGESRPLTAGKATWPVRLPRDYRAGATLRQGETTVGVLPETRFVTAEDFTVGADAYRASLDGDAKITGEATFAVEEAGPGTHAPKAGALRYRVGEGWKFVQVSPASKKEIEGRPRAAGFWLWSDERSAGDTVRLRFRDATGQTFQPSLPKPLSGTGWRWVTLPLDGRDAGSWGGARDGVVHYPIAWESVLLVDSHRKAHAGEVRIAGLTLLY